MDRAEDVERGEIMIGVDFLVLGKQVKAGLCVADDHASELFIRFLVVLIEMKERMEEVD